MSRPQMMRLQILELARRPVGVHMTDFPGCTPTYIYGLCRKLTDEGLLIKTPLFGKYTRYFANQADADAAKLKHAQAREEKKAEAAPGPALRKSDGEARPAQTGFRKDAKVVFTDRTKFTACPGYKPRFQTIETGFVHTALQSGRVTAQEQTA